MRNPGRYLILLAWALSTSAWAANAVLLDGAQLKKVLKKGQPCCVIDARSEGRRKQQPIPFAVIYQDDKVIKPKPDGFAVVVADNDERALAAARSVVGKSGGNAYAVKGGYAIWKQVQAGSAKFSAGTDFVAPQRFTIPTNTCEPGKPVQEYK